MEESPSPSLSTDASYGDDKGEMGRGPLDHLPDIGEMVPGASASSPVLLGGGKRIVSPVGSTAAVEQVAVGATQLPL